MADIGTDQNTAKCKIYNLGDLTKVAGLGEWKMPFCEVLVCYIREMITMF